MLTYWESLSNVLLFSLIFESLSIYEFYFIKFFTHFNVFFFPFEKQKYSQQGCFGDRVGPMSYPVKGIRIPLLPTSNMNLSKFSKSATLIHFLWYIMNLHLQKMKIDFVGGQKFLVCLLTDGALLLKMYCQRDKPLGSSSLDPTSHPSQPMHSHFYTCI